MKKLDIYIIKSFLKPFFATFFVILFVLVMQAIWVGFDEISGKGISVGFILKFIGYLSLTVVPMAMPIGILLSSIMSLGDFAENYEFAAIKSAGISLRRFITPVMVVAILLSGINFLFLNNVYPHAVLKQKNMFLNMKKKQPALALIPGVFNTEIPGYVIKFDEKYGEEQNLLRNVQIADLNGKLGKSITTTAAYGEIVTEEGSKYMTFKLFDVNRWEDHATRRDKREKRQKMPFSKSTSSTYSINVDVSAFSNENLNDTISQTQHQMLSLKQLVIFADSSKTAYDEYIDDRAKNFFILIRASSLKPFADSINRSNYKDELLDNFDLRNQAIIVRNANENVQNNIKNFENDNQRFKIKRKILNLYDHEYHNRIAFSFACLVLFFIGAPLGSIIRKGGFGLPMVMAIIIFVVYFFISSLGKNLAEESAITSRIGGWLSTIILLPFGILLTRRAAKDKGIFSIDSAIEPIKKLIKRIKFKKK
ncbi:LptF/LptG family permease [Urechidicola vernalis]|uniref:LptF/LptG family permease n=1 Tax=Urechidicola vernalis TaxID=3075600 RepID=A0ABU2Y1W2_9FLAO|nr:LptF/LptG family permease [Urechidicola sp. P050]MDT0552155.1 LptF/LptG family permease [Urechidicola sp. P050]